MRLIASGIIGAALLAAGTHPAYATILYNEDFETLQTGRLDGQANWIVDDAFSGNPNATNDSLVVSDPSRAFSGTQFLAMGGLGAGPRSVQTSFAGLAVDPTSNYVLSVAVRFESFNHNGLFTLLNGNLGPAYAVQTWFNSLGHIYEVQGFYASFTDLGGTPMNTGEWYKVTYLVEPWVEQYMVTVVRASDNTTNVTATLPFASLPGGNPITTWSTIDFRVDAGPGNNWLIDNLSFSEIPEPHVSLLLSVAGVATYVVSRTRRRD